MSKSNQLKDMADESLRRSYVPHVFQPDIYTIDYDKLWEAGVRLISFDIDDTISGLEDFAPPKEAKNLFKRLEAKGFKLALLSNTWESKAKKFAAALGESVQKEFRAKKPDTAAFESLLKNNGLEKTEMAHVGNRLTKDILAGNNAGVITCFVRRAGWLSYITGVIDPKTIADDAEERKVKKELEKRRIWRKHHKYIWHDQYYQLGEAQSSE